MNMATEKTDGVPRSAWARWGSTIFSLAAILFTSVFSVACGKGDSLDGAWQPDNYVLGSRLRGTRLSSCGAARRCWKRNLPFPKRAGKKF